ncbi:MAG: 3-hydroxyacyl-CoA dehydrogenase family protein [Bacteroidia bacterium]|nr:3-hydroxyacyl-CoA dehydrogenase family protein [Bacteroidia bacterium]
MKILVRGSKDRRQEVQEKFSGTDNLITSLGYDEEIQENLNSYNLIFDLNLDEFPEKLDEYLNYEGILVVSALRIQLAALVQNKSLKCQLIGMNCLSGFINKPEVEISLLEPGHRDFVEEVFKQLNWKPRICADRVGLVTSRILFMIINEACYTLQEGTAGLKDIDTAMKLGTNYPGGPFEWADRIGIKHVYEILEAVYQDTHDERYKICPLLKTHYLKGLTFYSIA